MLSGFTKPHLCLREILINASAHLIVLREQLLCIGKALFSRLLNPLWLMTWLDDASGA